MFSSIKLKFSRIFLVIFNLILFSCSKSNIANDIISPKIIPPNSKLVGLDLYSRYIDLFGVSSDPLYNATLNFDFKCNDVYNSETSSVSTPWELKNVIVHAGIQGQTPSTIQLFQYIDSRAISCFVTLNSLTDSNGIIYTSTNKMILTSNPTTSLFADDPLVTQSSTYLKKFSYTSSNDANYFVVISGSSLTQISSVLSTAANPTGYKISFTFSKMKNSYLNSTTQSNYSPTSFVVAVNNINPPDDPNLKLTKVPMSNNSTQFKYILTGKTYLKNSGDTSTNNEAYTFFNANNGQLKTLEAGGLNFNLEYINYLSDSYLYNSGVTTTSFSPYESIVKNANTCKIFVISDSFYGANTISDHFNGGNNLPTTPPDPTENNPYPNYILSLKNLESLMNYSNNPANGVYNCLDIRDYFTSTDNNNSPLAISNYTRNPGGLYFEKYGQSVFNNPNNIVFGQTESYAIPITKNDLITNDNTTNWGYSSGVTINNTPASQTYYPEFNAYDVLIVYENKVNGLQNSSYRYSLIRKNILQEQNNENIFIQNNWIYKPLLGGPNTLVSFKAAPSGGNNINMHSCVGTNTWDTTCTISYTESCSAAGLDRSPPCLSCQASGSHNAFVSTVNALNTQVPNIQFIEDTTSGYNNNYQKTTQAIPTNCALSLLQIDIDQAAPKVAVGSMTSLTATGTYSNNSTQDITTNATWVSFDPSIATVNPLTGTVTGVSTGFVTILASYQELYAVKQVQVKAVINPENVCANPSIVTARVFNGLVVNQAGCVSGNTNDQGLFGYATTYDGYLCRLDDSSNPVQPVEVPIVGANGSNPPLSLTQEIYVSRTLAISDNGTKGYLTGFSSPGVKNLYTFERLGQVFSTVPVSGIASGVTKFINISTGSDGTKGFAIAQYSSTETTLYYLNGATAYPVQGLTLPPETDHDPVTFPLDLSIGYEGDRGYLVAFYFRDKNLGFSGDYDRYLYYLPAPINNVITAQRITIPPPTQQNLSLHTAKQTTGEKTVVITNFGNSIYIVNGGVASGPYATPSGHSMGNTAFGLDYLFGYVLTFRQPYTGLSLYGLNTLSYNSSNGNFDTAIHPDDSTNAMSNSSFIATGNDGINGFAAVNTTETYTVPSVLYLLTQDVSNNYVSSTFTLPAFPNLPTDAVVNSFGQPSLGCSGKKGYVISNSLDNSSQLKYSFIQKLDSGP